MNIFEVGEKKGCFIIIKNNVCIHVLNQRKLSGKNCVNLEGISDGWLRNMQKNKNFRRKKINE